MGGVLPTEANIQITGPGVPGRSSGAGLSSLLNAAALRSLCVVYSTAEVDWLLSAKAAVSHSHAAADITSGVFASARLGSGGAGGGAKFLADDQTFKIIDLSTYLLIATAASTYQPLDSDLTTIAGLTATTDSFMQAKAGAWAARTIAQVKTDLSLTGSNSGDFILNTLTGQTQTFAVGTAGTDHAIVSTGTTHTFNLPDASATARGVITTGTQTIAGAKTFGGTVRIPNGSVSDVGIGFANTGCGMYMPSSTVIVVQNAGSDLFAYYDGEFHLASTGKIGMTASGSANAVADTFLARNTGGGWLATATSAASVPATFKGAASQTAKLTEWQNNAGSVLLSVSADGRTLGFQAGAGTLAYNTTPSFVFSHQVAAPSYGNTSNSITNAGLVLGNGTGVALRSGVTASASTALTVSTPDATFAYSGKLLSLQRSATEAFNVGNTGQVTCQGLNTALTPLLSMAVATKTKTVSNKALTSNVATLTTSAAHGFFSGETVVVTSVDATFDGPYTIASVPSSTTFTYAKTAGDVASTAASGTVTVSHTGNLAEWQNSSGTVLSAVDKDGKLIAASATPASATAAGVAGTIVWDANYIYICTATNTWKRVAIATW